MKEGKESDRMDRMLKGEGKGGEDITKEVLTAEELARYLGFNKNWVYRKAEAGEILGIKLGNRWRFKKSVIDRWIEEQIERRGRAEARVKEKDVKAEAKPAELPPEAAGLFEGVIGVIKEHPDGVTLNQIGEELEMDWRSLTSYIKQLVYEGRIRKEGREYFPAESEGRRRE